MAEKEKIVTIRIKGHLLEALEQYCESNFADQSSVIRMALAQWPPIRDILKQIQITKEVQD